MKEFTNINEILDFAMAREQGAVDFYTRLSSDVSNTEMKDIFIQFAKEEMGHKAFLQKVKREGSFEISQAKIADIKIADYLIPQEKDHEKMTYPEALVLAMRREKAAYDLYKKISASIEDPAYSTLFGSLAQEELKHKHRFETEYDDYLSRDN
jgi:rubrerythrin